MTIVFPSYVAGVLSHASANVSSACWRVPPYGLPHPSHADDENHVSGSLSPLSSPGPWSGHSEPRSSEATPFEHFGPPRTPKTAE